MTLKELLEKDLNGVDAEEEITIINERNEYLDYTLYDTVEGRKKALEKYLNYDVVKYYTFGANHSDKNFYKILIIIDYKSYLIKSIEHEVNNG